MDSNPVLIDVDGFSFRYPGSDEFTLNDVDLRIERGEFRAMLGSNGSGKTTLCKTFNGLVPHFFEGAVEGRVVVDGTDTQTTDVGTLSQTVGYVYQDFENQLIQPTVRRDVEFGPLNYGFDDYHARATRALERLEIEHLSQKFIWELSGGEKHLAAIAGVLALEPSAIIVDEPAAQLDPQNAAQVYEMLAELHAEGQTIIVIEHDTEFVAEYTERVSLIDDGEVRWTTQTPEALNRISDLREHDIHPPPVTQLGQRLDWRLDASGSARYPITVNGLISAAETQTSPKADGGVQTARQDHSSGSIVRFDNVLYEYQSMDAEDTTVFDGLSLSIDAGENVALVGSNGAGKSTLLRLITGLIRPNRGTVEVMGTDTSSTSPERLADDVVYIHQQPEKMFIEDSIEGDVGYYLRQRGTPGAEETVDDVLEYLDLTDLREQDGRLLSIGQQRRASLAIGLAMRPSLVLLDEPTGCLDVESRREVATMLGRVDNRVDAVVVATHDLEFVASWADRVVAVSDGGVVADASPAAVLTDEKFKRSISMHPPQVVQVSRRLGVEPPATTVDELVGRLGGTDERE